MHSLLYAGVLNASSESFVKNGSGYGRYIWCEVVAAVLHLKQMHFSISHRPPVEQFLLAFSDCV